MVAATETVMAGTVEITWGGIAGVTTDIRLVVVLGTTVATGCSSFG